MSAEGPMLLLWGCTGVGKTSLVTAGLFSERSRLNHVDWAMSDQIDARLASGWRGLNGNAPMAATTGEPLPPLDLRFVGGTSVRICDIKGEIAHQYEKPVSRDFLKKADAVLFVVEWNGRQQHEEFRVIHDIREAVRDRPVGLAFTKCERSIRHNSPIWSYCPYKPTQGGWWKRHPDFEPREQQMLEGLAAVWPTSVYGFHADGRPACLLDEFGGTIPYKIKPINATNIFLWYFRELKLWPST